MTGKTVLGYYAGTLCVVFTDTVWSRPEAVTHYWPVRMMPLRDIPAELGTPVESVSSGTGLFRLKTGDHWQPYVDLRLADGAATRPIKTESREIPRPKTTRDTRWNQGRWEKYYAGRGAWL